MSTYKVTIGTSKSNPIIIIYYNNNRFRFWNGNSIDVNLKASENPILLKAAFELKLLEGWRPKKKVKQTKTKPVTVIEALQQGIEHKVAQGCSPRFIKDAKRILKLWQRFEAEQQIKNLTLDKLHPSHIKDFLIRPVRNSSCPKGFPYFIYL